jgi:hypothetical protein
VPRDSDLTTTVTNALAGKQPLEFQTYPAAGLNRSDLGQAAGLEIVSLAKNTAQADDERSGMGSATARSSVPSGEGFEPAFPNGYVGFPQRLRPVDEPSSRGLCNVGTVN